VADPDFLMSQALILVELFPYCTWCRRLYSSVRGLKAHCNRVHGQQTPYYDLACHLYNALKEADKKKVEWGDESGG